MNIENIINELYDNKEYDKVINTISKYIKKYGSKLSESVVEKYFLCLSYYGFYDKIIKYLKFKESKPYENNRNPYKNIENIGKCLDKKIVNESILIHYYVELLKIGKFEEAYNIVKKIKLLYPNYLDNFFLTCLLLRCNKQIEAKQLILMSNFNGNQLIKIAALFIMLENYTESKKIVKSLKNKEYEFKDKEDQLDRLLTIQSIKKCFIKMRYEYFKINHKLKPGDIIYTRFVDDKFSTKYDDYKDRPFMIWKIEDDTLFTFPLSALIPDKSRKYIIHHQDYINLNSDRIVKDTLAIIKEKDVQSVLERINKIDYNNILSNLYSGLVICKDDRKREEMKQFMNEYFEKVNIEIGCVIAGFNKELNSASQYIVIGEDEDNYYGVRVRTKQQNIVLTGSSIEIINKRKEVLRKVPLSDHNKEQVKKILKKLKEKNALNYENTIIQKNKMQYQVILQDKQKRKLLCKNISTNENDIIEIDINDNFTIAGITVSQNAVQKIKK